MLAIRMQRTGRKGHAQFRLIVQESRRHPSSGAIVAALGSYDPHTKAVTLDKEKATTFLNNGAQPSPRVAMLLQAEGVTLPSWVKQSVSKQRAIRNTEKLRRNQPKEEVAEAPAEVEVEKTVETVTETENENGETVAETTVETTTEKVPAAEAPAEGTEVVTEETEETPKA